MSKFWQKKYTSKYSGKQIDDAIEQVIEGGGGGGGAEYIDAYVTGSETSIKYTIAEIKAMVEAGKTVILRLTSDGVTSIFDLGLILSNQVVFSGFVMDEEFITFNNFVFQDLTKPAGDYKAHVVNNYFYEMEYTGNN